MASVDETNFIRSQTTTFIVELSLSARLRSKDYEVYKRASPVDTMLRRPSQPYGDQTRGYPSESANHPPLQCRAAHGQGTFSLLPRREV
jgi:hypothetical protein